MTFQSPSFVNDSQKHSVLLGVVTGDNGVTSDDRMYELWYGYEYS